MPGSSPLTRGKPRLDETGLQRGGLIPAHTGKTPTRAVRAGPVAAHPRSRGENGLVVPWAVVRHGSSPLTRGKLATSRIRRRRRRLIPAHAGKTGPGSSSTGTRRAHPRSRGENWAWLIEYGDPAGSSPLTRGKHVGEIAARDHRGLIPAHAGKTSPTATWPPPCPAHPRSRGENRSPSGVRVGFGGSSPLTRGKRSAGCRSPVRRRLIPAHAGKTCNMGVSPCDPPAHPRSRGENHDVGGGLGLFNGSSPLTRGKPHSYSWVVSLPGLIPAHAGKTTVAVPPTGSRTAHPRSRGENSP